MIGPNLSAIAVRERAITLFLIVAILAAGAFAFLRLGRAEDPSFTIKYMSVAVAWPGASAEEMERQVTDRLEKSLQELRWYDRVETTIRPGFASMVVALRDSMPPSEVPEQWYQVRKRLGDEAKFLPRGTIGPFFNDDYSDVFFSLYALSAPGLPHRQLVDEADAIRARLLKVPGVQKVVLIGEQPQRIHIEIDPARIATLGITPDVLIASLARQNGLVPAGSFETSGPSVFVRSGGAYQSLAEVRATPVAAGGQTVRLGDIAEVDFATQDPPDFAVRHQQQRALMLGVVMAPRWNGMALGKALQAETDAVRSTLPLELSLEPVVDQARNIAESYGEFMIKFVVALSVIMVVSLITLGWRVGIVVAAAVPLTLAAVFVIMLVTGRDFDRITLGALVLSLGLLVDDAIIAIEMMVVKMQEGMDRVSAATFAWGATASPMLAGTLVTVIGFLPVGFARSTAGEYAGNIFWIVGFALLASWVVAVWFTPYLGVKLLPQIEPVEGGHDAIYATARYQRLRQWVTEAVARRKAVTLATVGAMVVAGAILALFIPKQFFPSSDRSEVLVEVSLPKGSSILATEKVVARLEHFLRQQPETGMIDSFLGGGAPRFYLSLNPELPDPSFAKLVVRTADADARDTLKGKIAKAAASGLFPEARVRESQLVFGPPVPYPVVFRVTGPDIGKVAEIAEKARAVVAAHRMTQRVHLDWGERAPAVRLAFNQDQLRLLGLTPNDVSNQVAALTSGAPVSQVRLGTRVVEVVLRATGGGHRDLAALETLPLRTATGAMVTVGQVARLEMVEEYPLIKRRDRRHVMSIRADIQPGLQPPDVTAALLPELEPLKASLPSGYAIETGGATEESGKANAALAPLFPIMILAMLLVIIVQVRSFRLMALVFATAPLGLIGAVLALVITGSSFGFNAILGLIGLAGILMRNTLILTDQIAIEQARGLDLEEAVIEATVRRARPVILTALAAVLAFLPLTLSTFWGPLAIVLIGGTIVGTVLTLFFLPTLFVAMSPRSQAGQAQLA